MITFRKAREESHNGAHPAVHLRQDLEQRAVTHLYDLWLHLSAHACGWMTTLTNASLAEPVTNSKTRRPGGQAARRPGGEAQGDWLTHNHDRWYDGEKE
jgi:hypothetical protein